MTKILKIKRCRICSNQKLIKIIDLKDQYKKSSLLKKIHQSLLKKKFHFNLFYAKMFLVLLHCR